MDAADIAAHALAANVRTVDEDGVSEHLLVAGGHQFDTVWARDLSMATAGALVAGQTDAVRDSLAALLSRERADGLVPRGVDHVRIQTRVVLALLGIRAPFRAPLVSSFETENGVVVIDGNAAVPWAASEYVDFTRDRAFADHYFPAAARALDTLAERYGDDGLIGHQPPYADWEDSVARTGKVAFTNELYWLALDGMTRWAAFVGQDPAPWKSRSDAFLTRFHAIFWDPGRGEVRNFDGDSHLAADANLLAVAHGMLTRDESARVLGNLEHSDLWTPMPGRPTVPEYSPQEKDGFVKLVGLSDYHDRLTWTWLTALAAEAEGSQGRCDERKRILDALEAQVDADGEVYEVLTPRHGRLRPVARPLYHAEHPFTWSAGMIAHAFATPCHSTG